MATQARPDWQSRWRLTLRPSGGHAGGHDSGHAGGQDALAPYRAGTPHTGRIVVGNPLGTPVLAAGLDLLDTRRFELAARRCGDWLERRLLAPAERAALAADPLLRLHELGCLFSVKESVLKALGGIPSGGRYPQIEVDPPRRGESGVVRLSGELAGRARERRVRLLAGAQPVCDGLVLSWVLALRAPATGAAHTIGGEEAA